MGEAAGVVTILSELFRIRATLARLELLAKRQDAHGDRIMDTLEQMQVKIANAEAKLDEAAANDQATRQSIAGLAQDVAELRAQIGESPDLTALDEALGRIEAKATALAGSTGETASTAASADAQYPPAEPSE